MRNLHSDKVLPGLASGDVPSASSCSKMLTGHPLVSVAPPLQLLLPITPSVQGWGGPSVIL